MITKVLCAGLMGIDAFIVHVEVDIKNQALPGWSTVGLADSEVRESKERVMAAIRNSALDTSFRKVTINLAPADIPKEGTAYDLAIAIGILISSGVISPAFDLEECLITGELALSGELRKIRGVLPVTLLSRSLGLKRVIVPLQNVDEARLVSGIEVIGFSHLTEVAGFLAGTVPIPQIAPTKSPSPTNITVQDSPDFSDIRGQHQARRALEIAASGGHNILFSGPPGCGKTLLASRLPGILPPPNFDEILEITRIYSIANTLPSVDILKSERPFRSPHHSISHAGLIGGGSLPRPGEVTLAHNGVLFLDELPEFSRHTLETLRQPLESGIVTIARARQTLSFPASFMLVASCNPCPCGFSGHPEIACRCSPQLVQAYKSRLSGPLLDRIDIHLEVPATRIEDLRAPVSAASGETSAIVADRVAKTRAIQNQRLANTSMRTNAAMNPKKIAAHCTLDRTCENLLQEAARKFSFSARVVHRILKVARTIADMAGAPLIGEEHLLEALQYRPRQVM